MSTHVNIENHKSCSFRSLAAPLLSWTLTPVTTIDNGTPWGVYERVENTRALRWLLAGGFSFFVIPSLQHDSEQVCFLTRLDVLLEVLAIRLGLFTARVAMLTYLKQYKPPSRGDTRLQAFSGTVNKSPSKRLGNWIQTVYIATRPKGGMAM